MNLSHSCHKLCAPSSWLTTFMQEVFGLFPTPFLRAPRVLGDALVGGLIEHFSRNVALANSSSPNLVHTALLRPGDSPLLVEVAALLNPLLPEFGALMFGERLGWSLKEMWVNVLDTGGRQAMHNHANSFISGVVYLTPTHPDARTVFMRNPGGTDFSFKNEHAGVTMNAYNADKWISMQPEPGDVVFFPSYLMHAVPKNPGARRITMAFNAIPASLDSWGYKISFSG
jgi:putative 2-oxoglutarate-Fe(II)-dependent oxygenase superfamily protein